MTVQIGRVGIDIPIEQPTSGRWSGDQLDLDLLIGRANTTPDELMVLRDQLLGLMTNPDEPVVPVIADPDSGATGFYRVTAVTVDQSEDSLRTNGALTASVSLQRIASSSAPLVESRSLFGQRDAGASPAPPTMQPWIGIPSKAWGLPLITGVIAGRQCTGADGVYAWNDGTVANGFTGYGLAPGDWYEGAATIRQDGMVAIGRQATEDGAQALVVENGLISVDGNLTVTYIASNVLPSPAATFSFGDAVLVGASIVRNSPECVIVSYVYRFPVGSGETFTVFVSLRRGALMAEFIMRIPFVGSWGIANTSDVSAAVAVSGAGTYGIQGSGANPNWVLASGQATSNVLSSRSMTLASPGTSFSGAFGFTPEGTLATGDRAQDLVAQYMAAGDELVRVVGR